MVPVNDKRGRREDLGNAPTTPAPDDPLPHAQTAAAEGPLAKGSDGRSTLDGLAEDQAEASAEPVVIGHFIVRRRIGEGGMGIVYAGEDANLGRPVALKLVRGVGDQPAYRARLHREAQAMARLEHPNVVKVYEIGEDGDRLFIAMELVDGVTLSVWLRERRPWQEIVEMFAQVGAGLAAVHRSGLVHRDFKPDNVLVDRDGHARVADFGLARLDREGEVSPLAAPLTRTGAMMGTPGYMAPEQQFGGNVDARADQYSFCVALREALGGRPLDETRWKAVPREVRDSITRGLSYDPDERYLSIEALMAAIKPIGRQRRPWLALGAGLVVVVGVAGALALALGLARRDTPVTPMPEAGELTRNIEHRAAEPIAARNTDATAAIPHAISHLDDASVEPRSAADAGAVAVVPPVHPGVVRSLPHAPADVGVLHAVPVARDADVGIVFPAPENDPRKDYNALRTPAATVGDPAHLAAVRATLKNLGYDGVDLGALDRDPAGSQRALETELGAQSGDEAEITRIKLAIVKRRRGDCDGATQLWQATKLAWNSPDPGVTWFARAHLGIALCMLAAGQASAAYDAVTLGLQHGNRDEALMVMAIAMYDQGKRESAHGFLIGVSRSANPRVLAALKIWLDATGLIL